MFKFGILATIAGLVALPLSAQDAEEGRVLFERQCAVCHALDARGNGPMVPNLVIQPHDLTLLSQNNDGVFPIHRVVMRIDGREPLVSHGSPMPIYGDFFEGRGVALKTDSGQPIMTSAPIVDLVTWLQSIQK